MTTTDERVYTRAELQHGRPAERPKIRRPGDGARVAATRQAGAGDPDKARYAVPSPCCGKVTMIPQWQVDRIRAGTDENTRIECGKPWSPRRGRPRNGGCRAVYDVRPIFTGPHAQPTVFELTWKGR